MIYLDTSSLVALYYPEAKSDAIVAHLRKARLPIAFTWLHEVEVTNGLQLQVFRGEAEEATVNATLNQVRHDAEKGILFQCDIPWPAVFQATLRLSRTYSRLLGTRSLDMLHVATAITLEAKEFMTGDERQAKVAEKEGLRLIKM